MIPGHHLLSAARPIVAALELPLVTRRIQRYDRPMNILAALLALALFATVGILIFGIIAMARGGEFNRKHGNKVMRWRVAMQAFAVVLVLLFVFISSVGGK
jgi:hypothetical protein